MKKKESDLALLGFAALCLGVLFVATSTTTSAINERSQPVAVLPSDDRKRKELNKDGPVTIEELQQQLDACIAIEDYETAAIIRDQIKALKI